MESLKQHSVLGEIPQPKAMLIFFCIGLGHWLCKIVYNIYFHPLRDIPGPRTAAISNIPYCWWLLGGRQPFKMLELHNKYGHVVRIAPNEVSFSSAQSWKDIYGSRPGHKTFTKSEFYGTGSFANTGVVSLSNERKPHVHKEMRGYLAGAFSDRSVLEQEAIVAGSIELFLRLVGYLGSQQKELNMSSALGSLTFDICGDLSFGATFGALQRGKEREEHPWISLLFKSLVQAEMADAVNRFPILKHVLPVLMGGYSKKVTRDTKAFEEICYKTVQSRIALKAERKDILTQMVRDRDANAITDKQIAAHASDVAVAGTESTATALLTTIYYLVRDQSAMSRLKAEIRDAFHRYEDVNFSSISSLPYLNAVLNEAMRIYPPVPIGLPRHVPEGGDTIDGLFFPEGITVRTNPFASCLSPKNFHDPWSFKPERWIQQDKRDILDCSQPFSLGSRACLGRSLAWSEMRLILAKLIWVYDLELVNTRLDWHGDSEMHTMWKKPDLIVHAKNRGVNYL
ncbi:benzoate 4-monooxygenase cytochrome P450 [Nemania abortiva]|nr:benzoate 4-monooxygenase cytochrome P450 [Nemania abortiva]